MLDTDVTPNSSARAWPAISSAGQVARKDAGFNVADRIHMTVKSNDAIWAILEEHKHLIKRETLSLSMLPGESTEPMRRRTASSMTSLSRSRSNGHDGNARAGNR